MDNFSLLIGMLIGSSLGVLIYWLLQRPKITILEEKLSSSKEDLEKLTTEHIKLTDLQSQLTTKNQNLSTEITELKTTLDIERKQTQEKFDFKKETEEQLSNQFKISVDEVLTEQSKKFTDQNKNTLDQIIGPLRTKISEFEGKVHEAYYKEAIGRTELKEQVKQLLVLNNKLSTDANNLTHALSGQSKVQGDFGEFILGNVLEDAGLRKGHDYNVQGRHKREDGTIAQPDVIINIPGNQHVIIDSKMSLTAYLKYTNSDNEIESSNALKKHLKSIHSHIKELSEKNYHQLYGVQSLDFVVMFIPNESAFMLANSSENDLCLRSFNKNILIASPNTVLFVLRIIANLWRLEKQKNNYEAIAKRGTLFLDKLSGFANDIIKLGTNIDKSQKSYKDALNKLRDGQGSLIGQAEELEKLGVTPTKPLPLESTNNTVLDNPSGVGQKASISEQK
ncbi:MAG: DNA recombination protein RmuC [Nitrosomonadaceae bacterium]|nr:DNA recombination protein RmuC [Nitrosomonadaceae bacterium]|tara:strand:- start:7437 stop:8786 length:1350 start_codon:yes stop_codon:yes gene_type:complete